MFQSLCWTGLQKFIASNKRIEIIQKIYKVLTCNFFVHYPIVKTVINVTLSHLGWVHAKHNTAMLIIKTTRDGQIAHDNIHKLLRG